MGRRLVCISHHDGEQAGGPLDVRPLNDSTTPEEMLALKRVSHASKGWTITEVPNGFVAVKEYPGHVPCKKRRQFRIEG